MTKTNRSDYARETEREMRDQMNGIQRDGQGNITHRHGKPINPRACETSDDGHCDAMSIAACMCSNYVEGEQ